jgi:bacillithiol system protein YtxJ
MNWIPLTNEDQLKQLIENSQSRPQVIFKHSTRCSISSMVKTRLEKNKAPESLDFYFLDLIANRPLSQKVASVFNTEHESPQVLLVKRGHCVYSESHNGIAMDEIVENSTAA